MALKQHKQMLEHLPLENYLSTLLCFIKWDELAGLVWGLVQGVALVSPFRQAALWMLIERLRKPLK